MKNSNNKNEKQAKTSLASRFLAFSFLFKEAWLFRNIFTFGSILKGILIYFFYIISDSKKYFSPLTINFLITSHCNFKCDICSYHANRNSIPDRITIEDMDRFARGQLRGKPVFFFGGGEPFIRSDFMDVLNAVKKYGFKCGIVTNGYLLDSVKINKLIDLQVELIIFSLFGPREVHDEITGIKGSYDKVIENASLLCKNKNKRTKVLLSCTISKTNLKILEEIPVIAKKVGFDAVKLEHLNFLSSGEIQNLGKYFNKEKNNINTFVVDSDVYNGSFSEELIITLERIRRKYGSFVFIKPNLSNEEIRGWYSNIFSSKRKCLFVWHSFFVKPDGMIVPCPYLQDYEVGNIKEGKLRDICSNGKSLHLRKYLKKQLLPECSRCCKL